MKTKLLTYDWETSAYPDFEDGQHCLFFTIGDDGDLEIEIPFTLQTDDHDALVVFGPVSKWTCNGCQLTEEVEALLQGDMLQQTLAECERLTEEKASELSWSEEEADAVHAADRAAGGQFWGGY